MARVFGMHKVELKPGVNGMEFEDFVCNEVIPVYNRVPGQTVHLLKGDQGERNGKYMVLIEIDSPERRDQIYPPPDGQFAEDVQELVADAAPVWDKLISMVEEFPDATVTDYVMVSEWRSPRES
jgi:hypothetical protein